MFLWCVRACVCAESATLFKLEEKQRGKHAKVKEYAVQCESPEEKAAWMTSLLNSIEEMKDKRKSTFPPRRACCSHCGEEDTVNDWLFAFQPTQSTACRWTS
jgi:aspartyl/asparaginyl beta-hydroxylase (cupin superfamily)